MSYLGDKVFTDAIKDVIGNDPVLDQYDIAYDASFYGTMQDDYVTGTMLQKTSFTLGKSNVVILVTGSNRGRAFSKYYAETQPPLDSTFGSMAVKQNPSLAFRQVPWHERVSHTSYRISQLIDSSERYYDSCLPNVAQCIEANGANLWTTNEGASQSWLSPYRNVATGSVAYMYFNSYEFGPLVDNVWTWSYPYENKYGPGNRTMDPGKALGIDNVKTRVSGTNGLITSIESVDKPLKVRGLMPILAGKTKPEDRDSNARNSFRSFYRPSGSFGTLTAIPAAYSNASFDEAYGFGYTIPADVNLNQKVNHSDFLSSYPGVTVPAPEYLTGTMTNEDTIRFLFGFGDMNNMAYGFYLFQSGATSTDYTEKFETGSVAANSLGTSYSTTGLTLNWSSSPTSKRWTARTGSWSPGANAVYPDTINYFGGGITANYNHYSGSSSGGKGLYWLSSSSPSDQGVLISDTNGTYSGNLTDPALPSFDVSACCVDVTSSYPWHLRYKRGVACHQTDGLVVYFAGVPGIPSGEYDAIFGGFGVVVPIEVVTGSGTGATGGASAQSAGLMTQYDSRIQGIGDNPIVSVDAPAWQYPFEPGAYRIVFAYTISGGSNTIGSPSIAAINDLQIVQLKENAFTPDTSRQKLGCNNYPKFRTYRSDGRYNPIASGYPTQVSGTADFYKSYNFAISPMIRGWKYGLYNGFPAYSKAVFRRDRFGQFRDMLEQRQDTKFINVGTSYFEDDAIVSGKYDLGNKKDVGIPPGGGGVKLQVATPTSPISVKFVKQTFKVNDKGIGSIYVVPVSPSGTVSLNLSTEVTSSQPYFDGEVRLRESKVGTSYGVLANVTNYPF